MGRDVKVRKLVGELYELSQDYKHYMEKLQERKKYIQNEIDHYLDSTGETDVIAHYTKGQENLILRAQRVMRKKVNYKPNRLEEKLGKEKCSKFITTKCTIRDWNGVVKLLKKYGVPASEFKKLIEVTKEVDNDKLDQEEAVGNISYDDLQGCFTVEYLNSYVRLTKRNQ